MSRNLTVASFWAGTHLTFFERVCIQSFLDHGYAFHLYIEGDVGNIPQGVIVHDACDVYSGGIGPSDDVRFNMGVYSDVFRIKMLQQTDHLWVDLDVYCARPLDFEATHYFGIVQSRQTVNNCVLKLPQNSIALQLIENFFEAPVPIPFWWRPGRLASFLKAYEAGERPTLYSLPWTTTGPNVLTWALRTSGELQKGQHWHTYYQYQQALDFEFLKTDVPISDYEGPRVRFVHLYGETKTQMRQHFGGLPPDGSYIAAICRRHDVDPKAHPIPA